MELVTVMRPEESKFALRDLCKTIKNTGREINTIVEIGSYMGESAEIFAQEFPKTQIVCVDPWLAGYDDLDSASHSDFNFVEQQFDLRTSKYPNIVKKKCFSHEIKITCAFVYIDGNHTYEGVKNDILGWQDYASVAICGHDYYTDEEILKVHKHIAGVKKAVDEILGIPDIVFPDGSWIKFKIKL